MPDQAARRDLGISAGGQAVRQRDSSALQSARLQQAVDAWPDDDLEAPEALAYEDVVPDTEMQDDDFQHLEFGQLDHPSPHSKTPSLPAQNNILDSDGELVETISSSRRYAIL